MLAVWRVLGSHGLLQACVCEVIVGPRHPLTDRTNVGTGLRCIILCRFVDLCRHRLSGDIAHLFADVVVPFARCERLKLGFHVHRRLALEPRVNRKDERVSALVIDDVEIARALHVVFVTHWIGGVAFVTLVALPLARAYGDADKGWALFEAIESRFATQVRFSIPLAGATGLWMAWRLDLWGLFAEPAVLVDGRDGPALGAVHGDRLRRSSRLLTGTSRRWRRRIRPASCSAFPRSPRPACGGDRHDLRRRRRRARRDIRMTRAAEQASRSAAASRAAWRAGAQPGFRPFFLAAGAWALIGMASWPPVFTGAITIPTAFSAWTGTRTSST